MKTVSGSVELKFRRRGSFVKENFVKVYAVFDEFLGFFGSEAHWKDDRDPVLQVAPSAITCVERISCQVDDKEHVLQIYFEDEEGQQKVLVATPDSENESYWLNVIRTACVQNEAWMTHYHDGVHTEGRWTCCRSARRTNTGCKETTILGLPRRLDGVSKFASPPQASQLQGFGAVAKSTIETTAAGQMSVHKDEILTILDASDKWIWRVYSHKTNRSGLLSQSLLQLPSLHQQPWFFRELSSSLALFILRPHGPGSFLVRSCRKRLVLSVNARDVVKHVGIYQTEEGQYYVISTDIFDTLVQLLDHYRRHQVFGVHLQTYPTEAHLNAYWTSDMSNVKIMEQLETPFSWACAKACFRDRESQEELLVCHSGPTSKLEDKESLRQVANVLLCIHHSNIQRLLAIGTNDNIFTMVTDYHGDVNLKDVLFNSQVNIATYLKLMTDICVGMAYLDRRGIIHKELIPENIVVDDTTAIIMGFHYSQFEGVPYHSNHVSYDRHRLTPPEGAQAGSEHHVTTKFDVWSYGVLIFVTFNFPECSEVTAEQILEEGQNGSGDSLVKKNLQAISAACLREDPTARTNFRDIWRQLRQINKNLPNESSSKIPKLVKGRTNFTERNLSFSSTSTQQTIPSSLMGYSQRTTSNMSLLSSLAESSPDRTGDVTNIRSTSSPRDCGSSVKSLPVGKNLASSNMFIEEGRKWTSLSDFAGTTLKNIRHVEIEGGSNSTLHDSARAKSGSSSAFSFDEESLCRNFLTGNIMSISQEHLQQPNLIAEQNPQKQNNLSLHKLNGDISEENLMMSEKLGNARGSWRSSLSGLSVANSQGQISRDQKTDIQLSKIIQMAQKSKYKYHVVKREKDAILEASEDNEKRHKLEISNLTSKLNDFTKQLDAAKTENESLQKCFDDNILVVNSALERLQRERLEMEQENKMVNERNETLGREVELLIEENQSLGEQVVKLLEENQRLKKQENTAKFAKEMKSKSDEIANIRENASLLQTDVTHLSQENTKLRDDNKTLCSDLLRLRDQVKELRLEMKKVVLENLKLKECNIHLEGDNRKLSDQRKTLNVQSHDHRHLTIPEAETKKNNHPVIGIPNLDTNLNVGPITENQNVDQSVLTAQGDHHITKNHKTDHLTPSDHVNHMTNGDVSRADLSGDQDSIDSGHVTPRTKTPSKTSGSLLSRLPKLSLWNSASRNTHAVNNKKTTSHHTGIPVASPTKSRNIKDNSLAMTSTKTEIKQELPTKLARPSSIAGVKYLGQQPSKTAKPSNLQSSQSTSVGSLSSNRPTSLLSRGEISARKRATRSLGKDGNVADDFHEFNKNNVYMTNGQKITLV